MEASFTAIVRGLTLTDLAAELNIVMADEDTAKLWRKIFTGHEKGTLMNPDKPGTTYLDEHKEAQQKLRLRHEKKKSGGGEFEEKPYICKPLTRETFRVMAGLARADYRLCAERILNVRPGEDAPRVTFRSTKNQNVALLKTWCINRKWKNILLQELSARDPQERGIWVKDSEGFESLNRPVWTKFKKDHGITRAKWQKLFDTATDVWLNKKRSANNKKMEASPALDKLLRDWLHGDLEESHSQVVTRFVDFNSVKKQLVIPNQGKIDHEWLSKFRVTAGFIDFRFIPGCVDEPVPLSVVESLVKHIADPLWSPGLKAVPAWMIVSDLRNHPAAVEFVSILSRKHPETFINVPSVYLPCPAEDLPVNKEVDSKRSSPFLYVDFLTCSPVFPRGTMFQCPMMAPESLRYSVKPALWSETTYEVNRGELRMETYICFLDQLPIAGGVVVNLFGGLKPIAAALMSNLNVFSYMDTKFMHTFPEKLQHIRPLRRVDFEDGNKDVEVEGESEGREHFQPQEDTPPLLLVSPDFTFNF